ncbi:CARD- and ANK-domain containing inflammasome adapter protein [Symphorus nematophorus]
MCNLLKGFDAQAASNHINPYAVDVIRAKRRDLVYGISHTEDLLDHLVAEGVMTAAKRSVILTIRTRRDQNCRVLDMLEAAGERACRKFFHPCLRLAEPDLYQQIKTYVGGVNERIRDSRRQLIGYLLERDQEGTLYPTKENKKSHLEKEDRRTVLLLKPEEHEPAQSKADKLLHMIATDGEVALLEELLENTDINTVTSCKETLLHVAAEYGHMSIVELLICKGARLDLQDNKGQSALHIAASRGHTEIVRALIQAGAPIYALDLQGKTPVHLAAGSEHLNSVKVLVKEEAKQSESHMRDMFLHSAAMDEDWRLAEMLLQSGATVDARNNHNKTALFYAVSRKDKKTLSILLNAGATVDRDVINEAIKLNEESILHLLLDKASGSLREDVLGSTLFSAVKQNHDGVVTVLIDSGANVNMTDKQGYTPLLLSAELGHTEVFRVLVAKEAKLDVTLSDLSSALHLAVHSGSMPIVQTLLEMGLDPNVTGPKAQTPLHLAAHCNRPELVDVLLRAGAQVNAVTSDGLTPLHIASQQGHLRPVIQLLQGKADPGLKDRLGRTALHWAASYQGESSIVDLLLSANANPNATDNEKKTALHLAALGGRVDAVTSLLSRKAKGVAKDMDGSTPLHYAAAGGHASTVSALLQSLNNKGIDERNTWRKTPLHAAAERGRDSVAVLLLEAGAKINSTDHSKDTPLHFAVRGGHQDVVRTLVNWGQDGHMTRRKKVNLLVTNNVGKTPLQVAEGGDTPEHDDIATLLMRKMFLIK